MRAQRACATSGLIQTIDAEQPWAGSARLISVTTQAKPHTATRHWLDALARAPPSPTLNPRRGATTAAGRQSGASFIGCGVVAALYHSAPPGAARRALRKLDYWSICYTSGVLRSAAGLRAPAALRAVAALATPVKPTLVTGANLIAIEARYLWYALRHAQLRKAFATHVGAAAAGVACFLADDVLVLERGCPPVFHPCWHVLSSVSLGLVGPLLTHCEGTLLLEGVQALVAA